MEKYYHFTSYENLESINQNGLIPKSGGRTRSIGDNRCAVFLSKGIQNAILMYSSILWHYNQHSGNQGLKSIRYYKDRIKEFKKLIEKFPQDEEYNMELEAMKRAIEWVKQIMSYKDFFEYMGDGVYLTISNIRDVNLNDLRDCYTTKSIPREKIKVVLLRNKQTGEVIDSRECVLAYFMSITPMENIIDNTNNVITMKLIKDLYENKLDDIKYYNSNNFKLEEVPINLYLSFNKNILKSSKNR